LKTITVGRVPGLPNIPQIRRKLGGRQDLMYNIILKNEVKDELYGFSLPPGYESV
jgi:hypothetical protein